MALPLSEAEPRPVWSIGRITAHRMSLPTQGARHLPGAVPRGLQVQLVDPAHQRQILLQLASRPVVEAAAADYERHRPERDPALRDRRDVLPAVSRSARSRQWLAARIRQAGVRRLPEVRPTTSDRNFHAHGLQPHPAPDSSHPYRPYSPDHAFRAVILPML